MTRKAIVMGATGGNGHSLVGYERILPKIVADKILHVVNSSPFVDLSTVEMMPARQVVGASRFSVL
jgi:hypothetical protein